MVSSKDCSRFLVGMKVKRMMDLRNEPGDCFNTFEGCEKAFELSACFLQGYYTPISETMY